MHIEPLAALPEEWKISEAEGVVFASAITPASVSAYVEGGRAFMRNAIQPARGRHVRVLVCELDGVRVYCSGRRLIVTRQDLNPN